MKPLVYAIAWLFSTTGIILSCVAMAYFLAYGHFSSHSFKLFSTPTVATSAVSKPGEQQLQVEKQAADARIALVQNFLERHKSPILVEDPEFAKFLVELADTNGMDFRLLPAIAMQESNLCKVVPEGSHNCLGLGVHKRGTWGFETYRDNFTAAAKILKENYIDKGLTTTELIESKYNPSSANRDGSWASAVNQFMAEMRYDDRALGKQLKTDANLLEFTTDAETPSTSPKPVASPTPTTSLKPTNATTATRSATPKPSPTATPQQ